MPSGIETIDESPMLNHISPVATQAALVLLALALLLVAMQAVLALLPVATQAALALLLVATQAALALPVSISSVDMKSVML